MAARAASQGGTCEVGTGKFCPVRFCPRGYSRNKHPPITKSWSKTVGYENERISRLQCWAANTRGLRLIYWNNCTGRSRGQWRGSEQRRSCLPTCRVCRGSLNATSHSALPCTNSMSNAAILAYLLFDFINAILKFPCAWLCHHRLGLWPSTHFCRNGGPPQSIDLLFSSLLDSSLLDSCFLYATTKPVTQTLSRPPIVAKIQSAKANSSLHGNRSQRPPVPTVMGPVFQG
jgi:hypothetical protein